MTEFFEKKLYTPRDIEGRPNWDALEQLREVENYLRENYFNDKEKNKGRKLVGVAPYGSMVGGYSKDSSDVDVFILYDGPRQPVEKIRREFTTIGEEVMEEFKKRGKLKVSTFGCRNINPQGIFEKIPNGRALGQFAGIISDMSRVVTGPEIHSYRQLYKNELRKLPVAVQEKVIDDATGDLVEYYDALSARKFLQRTKSIQEPTETEINEVLEKRRELWKKRLEKLWL